MLTKYMYIWLECAISVLKVREIFIKARPNDKTAIHQAYNGPTKQGSVTRSRRHKGLQSRFPRCYGDMQAWQDGSTGLENTLRPSCPSFIKTDTTSLSESPNVILTGIMSCLYSSKGNKSNLHNLPPVYYVPFPRKNVTWTLFLDK